MLSPDTVRSIELLASEIKDRFEPPEFVPGCQVKSVADKDQYATDNGWIEAIVSYHNRQRCRWKAQFSDIAVDDFVDVIFYPSYRVYVVQGQSGSGALRAISGGASLPALSDVASGLYTSASAELLRWDGTEWARADILTDGSHVLLDGAGDVLFV